MKTCDSCKWWGGELASSSVANYCENPKSLKHQEVLSGKDIPEDWVGTDFEDEGRVLFPTGPKFGCIHHEKKIKRALILVLSSRREPWGDLMDVSMQTWDAEPHPLTRTLFYCANFGICAPKDERIRYSSFEETLENVSPRTIEAFEWALEDKEWDYLARPNSSCYVHKEALARHIQTLPARNVLRGAWTGGDGGFLWGGGQYIISRDVVEAMVEAKGGWQNKLMDDEAITRCAQGLGISMNQGCQFATIDDGLDGSWKCMTYGSGEPFTFTDFADLKKAEGHFFFRVKQDHNRRLDEKLMRELKKHLP